VIVLLQFFPDCGIEQKFENWLIFDGVIAYKAYKSMPFFGPLLACIETEIVCETQFCRIGMSIFVAFGSCTDCQCHIVVTMSRGFV